MRLVAFSFALLALALSACGQPQPPPVPKFETVTIEAPPQAALAPAAAPTSASMSATPTAAAPAPRPLAPMAAAPAADAQPESEARAAPVPPRKPAKTTAAIGQSKPTLLPRALRRQAAPEATQEVIHKRQDKLEEQQELDPDVLTPEEQRPQEEMKKEEVRAEQTSAAAPAITPRMPNLRAMTKCDGAQEADCKALAHCTWVAGYTLGPGTVVRGYCEGK